MENEIENFLNEFNYSEKNNYNWENVNIQKEGNRGVFFGENKEKNNDNLHVKKLKIVPSLYSQILKEIYFLILFKKQKCFVDLYDMIINDDKEIIFLLFKGNQIDLKGIIDSEKYHYLEDKTFIKNIIYEITLGIYFLHFNDVVHNDIKSSNILINNERELAICDFGSASYEKEIIKSYTIYYSPPEFLNYNIFQYDKKYDMWSLGVIIIELFLRKSLYFKKDSNKPTNTDQLKYILSKFGINEDISKTDLDILIKDDKNLRHIQLSENEINKIGDKDAIDLINHLLTLNPGNRYSAKEVLESNYLKDYLDIDLSNLVKFQKPLDFKLISCNIDKNTFRQIYEKLKIEFNKIK